MAPASRIIFSRCRRITMTEKAWIEDARKMNINKWGVVVKWCQIIFNFLQFFKYRKLTSKFSINVFNKFSDSTYDVPLPKRTIIDIQLFCGNANENLCNNLNRILAKQKKKETMMVWGCVDVDRLEASVSSIFMALIFSSDLTLIDWLMEESMRD